MIQEHIFSEEELSSCEIKLEEVEVLKELGKGNQGIVFLGQLHGELVAVKKLHHGVDSLSGTYSVYTP